MPDVLHNMLPGLGRDWTEILAVSQAVIFYWVVAYVMECSPVPAHSPGFGRATHSR
jgi:hypothetical protein